MGGYPGNNAIIIDLKHHSPFVFDWDTMVKDFEARPDDRALTLVACAVFGLPQPLGDVDRYVVAKERIRQTDLGPMESIQLKSRWTDEKNVTMEVELRDIPQHFASSAAVEATRNRYLCILDNVIMFTLKSSTDPFIAKILDRFERDLTTYEALTEPERSSWCDHDSSRALLLLLPNTTWMTREETNRFDSLLQRCTVARMKSRVPPMGIPKQPFDPTIVIQYRAETAHFYDSADGAKLQLLRQITKDMKVVEVDHRPNTIRILRSMVVTGARPTSVSCPPPKIPLLFHYYPEEKQKLEASLMTATTGQPITPRKVTFATPEAVTSDKRKSESNHEDDDEPEPKRLKTLHQESGRRDAVSSIPVDTSLPLTHIAIMTGMGRGEPASCEAIRDFMKRELVRDAVRGMKMTPRAHIVFAGTGVLESGIGYRGAYIKKMMVLKESRCVANIILPCHKDGLLDQDAAALLGSKVDPKQHIVAVADL